MFDPVLLQRIRVALAADPMMIYRSFSLDGVDSATLDHHLKSLYFAGELDARATVSNRLELLVRSLTPYGLLQMERVRSRCGFAAQNGQSASDPAAKRLAELMAAWMRTFD